MPPSPLLTQAPELVVCIVNVLSEASFNDHNKEALLKAPGLAASLLATLEGEALGPAAAVAQLLDICSAHEATRRALSAMLAEGGAARAGRLLQLLPRVPAAAQAAILGLLGNCAVEVSTKAALRQAPKAGEGVPPPPSVFDSIAPLLKSPHAIVARRTAGLIGNLCNDATLRRLVLSSSPSLIGDLVRLLPPAGPRVPQAADEEVLAPVLAALANILVEGVGEGEGAEGSRSLLLREMGRFTALVELAALQPTVALRAASLLYRVAKLPGGCTRLGALSGALPRLVAVLAAAAGSAEWALQEALARLLALCAVSGPEAGKTLLGAGAAHPLVAVLAAADAPDGLVGNAALCLSELAKSKAGVDAIAALDPVPPLIAAAHKRRGAAQKNAAIALARLSQDAACLERLRELHGLEIIAAYVKL